MEYRFDEPGLLPPSAIHVSYTCSKVSDVSIVLNFDSNAGLLKFVRLRLDLGVVVDEEEDEDDEGPSELVELGEELDMELLESDWTTARPRGEKRNMRPWDSSRESVRSELLLLPVTACE